MELIRVFWAGATIGAISAVILMQRIKHRAQKNNAAPFRQPETRFTHTKPQEPTKE